MTKKVHLTTKLIQNKLKWYIWNNGKAVNGGKIKYLKAFITIFAVALVFAATGASAIGNYKNYSGVSLSIFKDKTTLGPHTKTEVNQQYYENVGTVNSCTGNENGIIAVVESEAGGKSPELVITKELQNASWGNISKVNQKRAYNLILKNYTSSACTAKHYGTWYLDKSAYDKFN